MLKIAINIHGPISSLVLACCAAATGLAGPLDQSKIAADAKWVVHLDFDAFRKSALGSHFVSQVIEPQIEAQEFLRSTTLSINLTNISSLTAYGPNFEKDGAGVLLLNTTADVKRDLDTLVGMASLSANEKKDVMMVQQKPFPLYNLKDGVFMAPLAGSGLLLAKSKEAIDQARDIAAGKGETMAKAGSFKEYADTGKAFMVVMAHNFNTMAKIPPQAQVLRETEGGRLAIGENEGENGKNVFFNLMFKGKDEESSTKIQQVLQGIVALVSMSQQNKDVTDLASATRIAGEGRNVSVTLQFPTAKAIEHVNKHVKVNTKQNEGDVEADTKAEDQHETAKESAK
ncbi:MAG: hypothetical protein ACXW3L_03925 [Limisphaerales bacterium]